MSLILVTWHQTGGQQVTEVGEV